jgi:hypothetical protein
MPELDRRLRAVSQLRKVWRSFRDPQERQADERVSLPIMMDHAQDGIAPDPIAAYGLVAVRAAVRSWWCRKQYEAIVALGDRLAPSVLDSDPLLGVYLETARSLTLPSSVRS